MAYWSRKLLRAVGSPTGALYDRYATQVFNYCLRLTGSPDDAGDATQEAFVNVLRRLQDDDRPVLDFASYLFAAARHESYALMRMRARLRPSDSPPEPDERGRLADLETDPERAVLLRDSQEAVREANALLAPRHREVLALREVAGRSYDEIAETMGISENAAAQLIWRARSKLREAMTAGAVASVVATTEDCETAQLLLNRIEDGEPVDDGDREWLDEHLEECGSCRAARGVLVEAGASYRCWAPVALFAGMRADTLAHAGQLVGADWSHIPAAAKAAGSSAGSTAAATATAAVIAAVGIAALGLTRDDEPAPVGSAKQPAAAPAQPKQIAPARRATEPRTALAAARAPRGGRAPASSAPARPEKAARERSDGRAAPEPRGQPGPPESHPGPPDDAPRLGLPAPPEPRAGPPAPPPSDSAPVKPSPRPPAPAVDPDPPAPRPAAGCSWPGAGNGPSGCPPGHGGVAPGHGGVPPGYVP